MWLMKTLLTSVCINQREAGHQFLQRRKDNDLPGICDFSNQPRTGRLEDAMNALKQMPSLEQTLKSRWLQVSLGFGLKLNVENCVTFKDADGLTPCL